MINKSLALLGPILGRFAWNNCNDLREFIRDCHGSIMTINGLRQGKDKVNSDRVKGSWWTEDGLE